MRNEKYLLVCILLVCVFTQPVWGVFLKDDISVSYLPGPTIMGSGNTRHGYVEVRFQVKNISQSRKHDVEIFLPQDPHSGGQNQIVYSGKTVEMMPGSKSIVSIFMNCDIAGRNAAIVIDGGKKHDFYIDYFHHEPAYTYGNEEGCLLVSRAVPKWFTDQIEKTNRVLFRADEIGTWSANWLGYSRFDAITITADELNSCSAGVLQAVGRYVRCGGILSVIETGADISAQLSQICTSIGNFNAGFGQIIKIDRNKDGISLLDSKLSRINKVWDETSPSTVNKSFSVLQKIQVSMRGMLSLVIVFAILVGPVNIWWLSRKRKRIWMLWIIPAVSLVMCGIVFGYSLLAEGWRGTSRIEVVTILDQGRNESTSIGWIGYYSPLTPGAGLHFAQQTELFPIIERDFFRISGRNRTIDWTSDQHLKSGWVSARVPSFFMVRKPQTRRERLSFTGTLQEMKVVNGLGSKITRLYYMDKDSQIWCAEEIPPGAVMRLRSESKIKVRKIDDAFTRLFATKWFKQNMDTNPGYYLQPGTYIALLQDCDFIGEGLANLKERNCHTVVYGIVGSENK